MEGEYTVCPAAFKYYTRRFITFMDEKLHTNTLTFTSVGPGFKGAAVLTGCVGVTAGRLAGSSLVESIFTKSVVACVAAEKA